MHTKEGCFKIVGYPEWWDDLQKRRAATKVPASRTGGKAHLITADQPDTSCSKSGKGGDWCKGEGETVTTKGMDYNGENQKEEERESLAVWEEERKGDTKTLIPPIIYNPAALIPTSKPLSPKTKPNTNSSPHNQLSTSLLSLKRHP